MQQLATKPDARYVCTAKRLDVAEKARDALCRLECFTHTKRKQQKSACCCYVTIYKNVYLPPTKEEVSVFARVRLSVCLSVCMQLQAYSTRSSAIADKPLTNRAMSVCKVVEVCMQDFLSEYVDKKFTYICYRRLIRHE